MSAVERYASAAVRRAMAEVAEVACLLAMLAVMAAALWIRQLDAMLVLGAAALVLFGAALYFDRRRRRQLWIVITVAEFHAMKGLVRDDVLSETEGSVVFSEMFTGPRRS